MCPPLTYSPLGAPNCTACPPNSFSQPGSQILRQCACIAGYFKDPNASSTNVKSTAVNEFKCLSPPVGEMTDPCVKCPPFATSLPPAESLDDCFCLDNYTRIDDPYNPLLWQCAPVDVCADERLNPCSTGISECQVVNDISYNCDCIATVGFLDEKATPGYCVKFYYFNYPVSSEFDITHLPPNAVTESPEIVVESRQTLIDLVVKSRSDLFK